MGAKLIAYECVAVDHQPSLLHPDKLTIYERAWAFCPFDARAAGHQWRRTGDVDLDSLARRTGLSTVALPEASESSRAKT